MQNEVLICRGLPQLEAAMYRRNASTNSAFAYHNHLLQGSALRYMCKELTNKEMLGVMRYSLVQGTRRGKMSSLYLNEATEISADVRAGIEFPHPFIINVSGVDSDGLTQRWQLSLPTEKLQLEWVEALKRGKEFVCSMEQTGEKDLLMDLFRSMFPAIRRLPRISPERVKIYPNSFMGSQVVKYLTKKENYTSSQALSIAQNMLNLRILEHVENEHAFHGNRKHLYRFSRRLVVAVPSAATTNDALSAIFSKLLLPDLSKGGRSDTMEEEEQTSSLSPTTIHLLRLRKQAQAELRVAVQTIENQEVAISTYAALHARNYARGELLFTRTRRVELLCLCLQVLLAIEIFSPSNFNITLFVGLVTLLCSAAYHIAPVYRYVTGEKIIESTSQLALEDIRLSANGTPRSAVGGGGDEDDDDEEDDEEEEEDDELVKNEVSGEAEAGDEEEDDEEEEETEAKGLKRLVRNEWGRLKKVHKFLQRVRTRTTSQLPSANSSTASSHPNTNARFNIFRPLLSPFKTKTF